MTHAMANLLDDELGRIVSALRTRTSVAGRSMWNETLLVFQSDNGGEIMFAGVCGGNNWPLTGGKFSNWEGGIRVPAFVAGGALPAAARGTVQHGFVTSWDWYSTFAALAGVDPTDVMAAAAGLPPIDSINVWPMLSGANTSSPRSVVIIGDTSALGYNADGQTLVGGLIDARGYKILVGPQNKGRLISQYVQTGPSWPNTSSHIEPQLHNKLCGRSSQTGCLFNVFDDPTERKNIAAEQPKRFEEMLQRIDVLQKSVYSPDRGKADPHACEVAEQRGYWGPFLE